MADIPFEVWDVFTDRAFGGNQLAVIPDARGFSQEAMAAITREFGYSESAFLLPPETEGGTARARTFDPNQELPFAGHPTIGAACAIAARGGAFGTAVAGPLVLEEGVGPVACETARGTSGWTASFIAPAPFARLHDLPPETLARCLRLLPAQMITATHGPVLASKGLPFAVVELADAAALTAAAPDASAMAEAGAAFPPGIDLFAIYAYTRAASAVQARMFAPLSGIPEDPATGSAAAALAALLCDTLGTEITLDIAQGVTMGRPSRIAAEAWRETDGAISVRVGGAAVLVLRGEIAAAALVQAGFAVEAAGQTP